MDYQYTDSEFDDSSSFGSARRRNGPLGDLFRAWRNEKSSPEILPFDSDLIENVKYKLDQQDKVVNGKMQASEQFLGNLYKMEVDRIKYVLRSYLRIRLNKIEKFHFHIQKNHDQMAKLSVEEIEYCQKYHELSKQHLADSFLQFLPDKVQVVEEDYVETKPAVETHVFAHVKSQIGELEVDDEEIVTLGKEENWLIRYPAIQNLIKEGKIDLL